MSLANKILSGLSILWELSLATLSFVFFKTVKFFMRRLTSVYYVVAKNQAFQWKFASAEVLKMPGALPMIMTMGARWNTHAIVANAGPIAVKQSLLVNVATVERSAQFWTLVVCTFPGFQTVTTMSSQNAPFEGPYAEISLSPRKYWIALRYYRWSESVDLPALTVDGVEVVHSARVPSDLDGFYRTLARRSSLFYLCLHYYVFVLLRYRRYFPAAFVKREFLPMANPETQFYFGALQNGERLSMQLAPSLLISYEVYLTIYNLASFPVAWFQVTNREFATAETSGDCSYLVRIHNKGPVQGPFEREAVRISVIGCARKELERHRNH